MQVIAHIAAAAVPSSQCYSTLKKPVAWNLARNIYKLKEKVKATFFSATDKWIMPVASTITLEEKEFVVDSGANMHTFSKKDLNSAEQESARVSKSLTTVVTPNGEVHTKEEATVYGRELDLFVTVKLLEYTPAFLSVGKLCQDHGYQRVDHWPEATTHRRWQTGKMQHGELRTNRCPWFIDKLFKPSYTYLHLHHQYCRKQSIPHQQEVRVRIAQFG